MYINIKKNKRIVVIGGNAAGPAAAARAKRISPESDVLMIEKGSFISTGTCELPYLISGKIKDFNHIIHFNENSFFEQKGVNVLINCNVVEIDRNKKELFCETTEGIKKWFGYDSLVIATGSLPNLPSVFKGNLSNVFTYKSVSDYLRLKEFFDNNSNVKNIAVIGAGYIGIEVAEALKEIGINVYLIEKNEFPLFNYGVEFGTVILDTMVKKGIEFISNFGVLKPIVKNNKVISLNIDDRIIETDAVISAVGIRPNSELASRSNLIINTDGTIRNDSKLRSNDYSIFSAGDVTSVRDFVLNKDVYFPNATIAYNQGHIAGGNAVGLNESYPSVVRNIAVQIFNDTFSYCGITEKEASDNRIIFNKVTSEAMNLVKVIEGSRKIFGKIIYEKFSKKILGAGFVGGIEAAHLSDKISIMIKNKQSVTELAEMNFNYTPPVTPFVNILNILGKKVKNAGN